jgi:hypothetical protein
LRLHSCLPGNGANFAFLLSLHYTHGAKLFSNYCQKLLYP